MSDTPITLVLVNCRKSADLMHAFLQSTPADIVMTQEPRFGPLIPRRSDSDPDGVMVRSTVQHPLWDCYTPPLSDGETCLVATFVQKSFAASPDILILPQPDHPGTSPCSLFIDIRISDCLFCILNVYHQVIYKESGGRRHNLHHLFVNPLPSFIPTLVMGDFNTHSSTWSFPWATVSSWACPLEEWFEDSELELMSPPQTATRLGDPKSNGNFQRDSILDLVLLNDVATCTGRFSSVSVSFSDSLGSDHVALFICWFPPSPPQPYECTILPGFSLDDTLWDSWSKAFSLLPTPPTNTVPLLMTAADQFDTDIYDTCTPLFWRRMTPDFCGVRWWNAHCEAALTLVKTTNCGSRTATGCALRAIVCEAKRAWSNDQFHLASPDNVWKGTAWRHGRWANRIPPILKVDGSLATSTSDIRQVFSNRFFPQVPKPIPASHPDDPPATPPHPFSTITDEEVSTALADTSNKSALGPTGIGYKLLKWAHTANPERLTSLFNAAISLSTHPWKAATVIPVPKPNKPDY